MNMEFQGPKAGPARIRSERERLDALLRRATPIEGCGPAIPVAPARGPQAAFMPRALTPDGTEDGWMEADAGWQGFKAVQALDVFDRMVAAARRGKRIPPLTPGQIAMGRRYRALAELLTSDGTKLSALDASSGSSDGGNWMDRRLQHSAEFAMLKRRIGHGVALSVRRIRPSARGVDRRGPIMDRTMVDMVCLEGCTLDQVLVAHGWIKDGRTHKAITGALGDALDRMIGYPAEKLY